MQEKQPQQLRAMYAISRSLGMDSDNLHGLVAALTGKTSLKALAYAEAETVIVELKQRQKQAGPLPAPKPPRKQASCRPGGVTRQQQGKMWALIGELEKLDALCGRPPRAGGHKQRLCGAIKKATGMDAAPDRPFEWLKMSDGRTVIDFLVRLVASETKKAERKGCAADG